MKLLNVHMYLTPLCHLSCAHCYYDALRAGDDPGRLFSTEESVAIITWLCENYDVDLHLEGGELFLREDLDEILSALSPKALGALTVTTSGTVPLRVHPERLRALGELRISVEGHTNELQRVLRPTNLDIVYRTANELRTDAVQFTFRATLHHAVANCVPEMIASFVRHGVERISLFEYQGVGRGAADAENHTLTATELENILDELAENGPGIGVKLLKVSLSACRVPMALARRTALETVGFQFIDLISVPNLTINSNGDLGVSPWMITARKVSDCFANVFGSDFRNEITERLAMGMSETRCEHTSSLLLRYCAERPKQ
jgi:MoaA/NifB/PqqE/SkfB family radical SAM enzyme